MIVAACGVAYATTFDASGATTPLRRLGPARPFTLPVGVAGAARRHVAAWIAPDGDIRLARTANDRTWSVAAGQIPASRLDPGSTFPGGVAANGTVAYLVNPPGNPPRAVWAAVDGSRAGLAKIVTRGLARPKVGRIAPRRSRSRAARRSRASAGRARSPSASRHPWASRSPSTSPRAAARTRPSCSSART